jgi:Tol biopolymer transport system component
MINRAGMWKSGALALLIGAAGCGSSGGGPGGGSGHTRELTFPAGVKGASPRFSPDSAQLAYTRDENGVTAISVMSPTGTGSRDLATDGSYLTAMAWTGDGAEVVYAGDNDIRAVPVGGGAGRQVVNAFAAVGPDLSPDGKWLVYGVNGGTMQLADISQTPPVITDLGATANSPRFSPDGSTIAFWNGSKIQLMNVASHATTDVIDGDTNYAFGGVDWFADGQRLLAGTDRGIEIITLGPPVSRRLLADPFALLDVDLSPDEASVAYGQNGQQSLFVLTGF